MAARYALRSGASKVAPRGLPTELTAAEQEREWRACRGSSATDVEAFIYFVENYWHIRTPHLGRIKFELREAQRITVTTWIQDRYSIVLKARQIGFSTLVAALAFWETFFWEDHQEVLLSRTEREAIKLLKKVTYGYKFLPSWMHERGPGVVSNTQTRIEFDNESEIESLPSKSDPARGEAVYRVFVDEWAFLENPDDAWASIEPIADVGGRIVGLSTANGSGNFFHDFWVRARTGASGFTPLFFPYSANPDRGDEWYEGKAKNMPSWQLAQEYPRTEDEAFIKSGNPVFDLDMLDEIPDDPTYTKGYLHQMAGPKNCEFRTSLDGELRIWEMPSLGKSYVIGADIAEGLEHGDYSAAHVLDVRTGAQVAVWHGKVDPDDFATVLAELGWFYNTAYLGPEANNHGLATVRQLQRLKYPRIHRRRTVGNRNDKAIQQMGWLTTARTKPVMIDELNTALKDSAVVIRDKYTKAELRTFVRDADGKMHGSPFDDRVTSLAIAVQMLAHAFDRPAQQEHDTYMTGDWWGEQLTAANQTFAETIGSGSVRR